MRKLLVLLIAIPTASAGANTALTCASCHRDQARNIHGTGMANALQPAASAPILASHPKLTFTQGPYAYTVERTGNQSTYRVASGSEQFSTPIVWAFGLGAAGQTYLLNLDGHWYESRVSYYKQIDGLDLTVGARPDVPSSLNEALGRELSRKGVEECFNCHATNALSGGALRTENLTPGIQCGRCHEHAEEHLASMGSAGAKVLPAKLDLLTSEETADFCGQCHRTWATIASQGPHNITNVRFQPYRLVNSKCYDAADSRIRCTTCHDPHDDAPRPAAFYDSKCQSCHSAVKGKPGAKLCTVSKSKCVTCHMPKVEIQQAHNAFTDHWIRIARAGAPVPH